MAALRLLTLLALVFFTNSEQIQDQVVVDAVVEKIALDNYKRHELVDLVEKLGFHKKNSREEVLSDDIKSTLSYRKLSDVKEGAKDDGKEEL
ncbi:hypothetical protein ACF0H5_016968 [Mactra antiquata]